MEKLSIVIPTMNRYDSLVRTITYLLNGSTKPNEIVVVDQSTDAQIRKKIEDYLSLLEIKTVYYYQEMPSLTKARNIGMTLVSNEIVVQMDDDVDVEVDTLKNVLCLFEKNKTLSMIAGINKGGGPSNSLSGYLFGKKSYWKRNIGHVTYAMYGRFTQKYLDVVESEWAMGFFFVIKKSLFDKWNLQWDEKFIGYAYAEDLDFSYDYYLRSKREGMKCLMSNRIMVKHNVSTEWRVVPRKHTFMIVLHREYLSYKFHKSPFARLATRWSNTGELIRRILKHENPKDIWDAQVFCDKYRKDIKIGNFHYEEFWK